MTAVRLGALLAMTAVVAGCGVETPGPPVPARQFDDPGFVESGRYELRYAAIQASSLPPEVAAAYDIPQRSDLLVVNVSVLERRPGGLPVAVEAAVEGSWRGLTGEATPLEFRAITAAGALSYVAEAPLRDREAMILELAARPAGAAIPLQARLTRRFDAR